MNNSCYILILFLVLGGSAHSQDSTEHNVLNSKHILEFGGGTNLKNKYFVPYLEYSTPGVIWKNRLSFGFYYNGFRKSNKIAVFSEVNRFSFDVRANFIKGGLSIVPKLGGSLFWDLSDLTDKTRGFYVAPRFGCDFIYPLTFDNKASITFSLENTITHFLDGFWYEADPAVYFNAKWLWKFHPGIGINNIIAVKYQGKAEIGFYPYFKLRMVL